MKPYQPPIPADCKISLTRTAVMWYLVAAIKALRPLERRQLQKLANECSRLSGKYPLHQLKVTKQFVLKNYPEEMDEHTPPSQRVKSFTALQVVATMIAATWIMCNEDQRVCSSLYAEWPIKEALELLEMTGSNPITDVPLQKKRKPKNVRQPKIIEVTSYVPKQQYKIRTR